MNWKKFKQNTGYRVELDPPACELDQNGRKIRDLTGDWIIDQIHENETFRLSYPETEHFVLLGKDHLFSFMSNPARQGSGLNYAILRLHVQVHVQGIKVSIKPTGRPPPGGGEYK